MAADFLDIAWEALSAGMTGMASAGDTMMGNSLKLGLAITGALTLWAIFWRFIEFYGEDAATAAVNTFKTVFMISLLAFLFAGAYLGATGPKGVLKNGVNELVSKITGEDTKTGVALGLKSLVKAMNSIIEMQEMTQEKSNKLRATWNPIAQISAAVGDLMKMIVWALIDGVLFLLLLVAALLYLALYVIADTFLIVALVMGPIMIPFVLVERLSFLCDGWIRFSIGCGLLKIVISVLIKLAQSMVEKTAELTTKLLGSVGDKTGADIESLSVHVASAVPLILLIGLVVVMLYQAQTISGALISGSGPALKLLKVKLPKG